MIGKCLHRVQAIFNVTLLPLHQTVESISFPLESRLLCDCFGQQDAGKVLCAHSKLRLEEVLPGLLP